MGDATAKFTATPDIFHDDDEMNDARLAIMIVVYAADLSKHLRDDGRILMSDIFTVVKHAELLTIGRPALEALRTSLVRSPDECRRFLIHHLEAN
jgi:hypothetical protein